jgi:signal recognition particle GTPase
VQEVRALVKQFDQMRVMMRSMANGKMPDPQKMLAMSGQAPRPKVRRR